MRKTVAEWLDSHQKGMGMAKKKTGGKKSTAGLPVPTVAAPLSPKKKPARKKPKRKRKPR